MTAAGFVIYALTGGVRENASPDKYDSQIVPVSFYIDPYRVGTLPTCKIPIPSPFSYVDVVLSNMPVESDPSERKK